LFPHLRVENNLLYGRRFAPRDERVVDFGQVVDLLGIGALLDRWPARLSGGEKQRVAIGRALLANPRLLLLDEPLAALDEARRAEILTYIEKLRDAFAIPIVFVSHRLSEVERLAGDVAVFEEGRLVEMRRARGAYEARSA
jgi:molybdate transport system ATP-binding protein